MAIKLKDMLKKAEEKGYVPPHAQSAEITKPWQEDSILFNKTSRQINEKENVHKTIHRNVHELDTNYTQNVHNLEKRTQNHTQNNAKLYTKPYTKRDTNYTQNNAVGLPQIFACLKGLQRDILYFIYQSCKKNRSLISEPISKEQITNALNIKYLSVHNTIQRLVVRKFLIRNATVYGRGGLTIYELPENVYNDIFDAENNSNNNDKIYTKLSTSSHSSSNNIINTTTDLDEKWQKINLEPLRQLGFSEMHLKQLADKNLNIPEIVQESIFHFAYGLENNPKFKEYKEPLNVLMGVLRKGQAWIEANYRSAIEIAQENLLKQKQAERERLKALEEESYQLAMAEWQSSLSPDEIEKIAPARTSKGDIVPRHVKLSLYFRENIWPNKKKDYLIN